MERDYDGEIALLSLALAFYYIGHCVVCMDLAKGNKLIAQDLMSCHIIMWNRAWVRQWREGPFAAHHRIADHLEQKRPTDWPEMAAIKKRSQDRGREAQGPMSGLWSNVD